jgi:hypothetical protein
VGLRVLKRAIDENIKLSDLVKARALHNIEVKCSQNQNFAGDATLQEEVFLYCTISGYVCFLESATNNVRLSNRSFSRRQAFGFYKHYLN